MLFFVFFCNFAHESVLNERTREEVMAWLQKARERKDAFQKRANEIFAEEDRLRQQAADSHYYDIAVK